VVKGILAADPGGHGALALLTHPDQEPEVWDMPRSVKDLKVLLSMLRPRVLFGVIEDVHAMPDEGVVSVFKFGRGFGHLEMGLECYTPLFYRVRPELWKAALGLIGTGKAGTKPWCVKRGWTSLAKRRHDIREAACLAYYGFMCLGGV
jgi:hypothetical protein